MKDSSPQVCVRKCGTFLLLFFLCAQLSSSFANDSSLLISPLIYKGEMTSLVPIPFSSLKFLRNKVHDVNTRVPWFGYFCTPD